MTAIKKYESHSASGFTLIEILLVIVIIGILAAVVVPRFTGMTIDAKNNAAKGSIASISLALDVYEVHNGNYPPSLQSLITKGGESNWRGPYIKDGKMPLDPWGHEFVYSPREGGYELKSYGANGTDGGGDDITN